MRSAVLSAGILAVMMPAALFAQEPAPKPPAPVMEKPDMAPAEEGSPHLEPSKSVAKPKPKTVDTANARTVEEIIARVNNEIITKSELDRSKATAEEDARQDCANRCTAEQLQTAIEDRQKNALRDLIDQSLLVQRGKDMGIGVEPEVIKRLDQIRVQNKLADMDALEKAVTSQGLNWEDFKNNIRNGVLQQRVIGSEVGSHINISKEEVEKYYNEHKTEFVRPEQVALREIVVSTDGKKESQIPELKKKAETALKRVKDGEDFGEIAKRFSDGATKDQGGYLGMYKKGELSKELEGTVFKMKKNDLTDVLETKQGFLILQVLEHFDEGQQSVDKVTNEIMSHLYDQRMEPGVREYLKTLREQSYVVIKPGFVEAAGGGNSEIQEVSSTPEAAKAGKKGHKKFLLFGKRPAAS